MKYFILLCLSFFVFIPVSQADIHLEPYGGAGVSYSRSSDSKLFMSYMGGVRVGYSFSLLSAGLDLSLHHHRMGDSWANFSSVVVNQPRRSVGLSQARDNVSIHHSSSGSSSFNPLSVGAFVGVDLPLFFDCYGAGFISFGKKDSTSMTGYGLKAGISYFSLPFVNLNAELQWAYYQGGSQVRTESLHLLSVLLSVSIPLSFEADIFGGSRKERKSDNSESNDGNEEEQIQSFDSSDNISGDTY